MEKDIVEKFIISKEDFVKYFDNRKIITKEEHKKYILNKPSC